MAGRLEGKIALITGTAANQGRAAAMLFANEGAKVVGCDLDAQGGAETVEMVKSTGGEMVSMQPLDLGDGDQVQKWLDFAIKTYGRMDILYNNAGSARMAPIDEMSEEDWHFAIRNELDLVYLTCHYAWSYLKAGGNAVIINTASIAGIVGSPHLLTGWGGGQSSHCATKAGIRGLTKQLALEGGRYGIRANTICPGLIQDVKVDENIRRLIPLQRVGAPEDIAKVALFLASDDAAYITGADIVVDGGITAH
jgi:NAD(P)-dependent dehydrogenase (short-subunit alcohol dehydrogenase family)